MKRFAAVLLMLLCLTSCGEPTSSQPAVSPAFPEVNPGDGGVLTTDLIVSSRTIEYPFAASKPAFVPARQEGSEFVLRLCPDDSVPAGTDLSGIEVWVYDMVELLATHSDIQQYAGGDVRRYVTDAAGEVRFLRGDNAINLDVKIDALPAGIGANLLFGFYDPDENCVDCILSVPHSAQISVGSQLHDIGIELINEDGEFVYAAYSYTPIYTRRASAPDQVEVSGVVKCGELELPVFHTVDLSGEDEYYKLKKLEQIGLVTGQEQELLDSFGPYF